MRLSQICDKAIEYGFYLLFFLVPLIMTPWNYELFEYNKMMLVYFLTAIIVSAWLIKMVINKKFLFRRTFWDIPLLLFLTSQFTSTLLSIDRHTSLWGYYSRFHGGLLSIICYLSLYWAYVTNMEKSKTLNTIRWLFSSAIIVSVYGILEHFGHSFSCLMFEGNFGVDCWVQDVQNRVFATLGQPNWLSAWLVALMPIPMAMLIRVNLRQNPRQSAIKWWETISRQTVLYLILITTLYLCLLYTKSRSGLLGFGVAYIVFWGLIFIPNLIKGKKYTLYPLPSTLKQFLLITILLSLITITVGTPFTPSVGDLIKKIPKKTLAAEASPTPIPAILRGGTESAEIRKIVWKGAIDIWRHYSIFGSGVETFAYSYYQFRPVEHNLISEWDFLYNKAHNEYLNYLATTGIIGLGSYLLLIGTFIFWNLKQISKKLDQLGIRSIRNSLLAGYASILVTNFFGFSVVPVAVLFFLFPAMAITLLSQEAPIVTSYSKKKKMLTPWQWLGVGLILFSLLTSHYTLLKHWYADVFFARSNKLEGVGDYSGAFEYLQRAIALNSGEPLYYDGLAYAAANLAVTELSNQRVNLAISSSSHALSISSRNMNFWKTRAKVFYKLSQIEKKYLQGALDTLLAASELAPTDAKIFYHLGLVYFQLDQKQEAIKTLEKTVEMKADYQDARYALVLIYEQEGEIEKAIEQLEYILTYIHPGHPEANKKIKELKKE